MAKKIKFGLKMKDDVEVRSLQELKDHFDLSQVMTYLADGKLESWLRDRYYDDLADAVCSLDMRAPEAKRELCSLFGVKYDDEDALTMEEIEERNRKIERLKEFTDDEEIIRNVDSVAFSQEDLADILDDGKTTIYLCGTDFVIPKWKEGITYIGIQTTLDLGDDEIQRYEENQIRFVNLIKRAKTVTMPDEKPSCDADVVFLLTGENLSGIKNYLAYPDHAITKYEEDNDEEDDETEPLNVKYAMSVVEIPAPEIKEYLGASYDRNWIYYLAQDGQGYLLAKMKTDGSQNTLLWRWDREAELNVGALRNIGINDRADTIGVYFGRHCLLIENPDIGKRRIRMDGTEEDVYMSELNSWRMWGFHSVSNICETEQGLYTLSVKQEEDDDEQRYLEIQELLHDQKKSNFYKIAIDIEDADAAISAYAEVGNNIFFFLKEGENEDCEGFFYELDTSSRKIKKASKIKVNGYVKEFCVKGNQIIYMLEENDPDDESIVALNMVSGREKVLWSGFGTGRNPRISQMKIVGDQIYLMGTNGNCYTMLTDGTKKTILKLTKDKNLSGLLRHFFSFATNGSGAGKIC